ncbi:uncharacterized protein [Nicotiana sylvestris]|uniref:uncharacterized protein n=1 Tax=Nicotiana sylvestris TaxID=4096 RepID=UPI00388C8145
MQSSAWLYVIDAKTSYNILLGRPLIHENKLVSSTYHQCLKYYKGEVEKKIVADDEPFTEAESHFADAKFYLKNRIVKELKADDDIKSKNEEPTTKRAEVTTGESKVVTEENVALPTKRMDEGFYPNAYKLFAKAGYNPNKLSKLGKLPSEAATRQPREEVLKVKPYSMVYTKEHDEDEESVGSSYPVTVQVENSIPSSMYDNVELEDVSSGYHISFNDGDPQEDEDEKDAPPKLEKGGKTTIDTLKEVNLGTEEEPRPTCLSALLEVDEESTYIELLKEFRDVFAWSYKEMPGLDPKVAIHHLAVKNDALPIKQAQRRFRPDLVPLIETEVNKLIEIGFIRKVKYPTWVSSIVPVRKKNGQIRVCVDFRDLDNACPKNEFPLPIPELIIDATTGYEAMSFMDGSSGYNQIRMAPKDEELTVFRTPKGIYCYKVMLFGLKNVGATYQRAMQNNFDDLLHKNVECYVDDLVVKSREKGDHLKYLRMVFELLQRYQLRMNLLKCAFGVTSEKFLGFIVRHRGIKDAILKMPEPCNIHELKTSDFGNPYTWKAVDTIHFSTRKLCLALVFSIQKLKHYVQAHVIRLVSRANPIKFMMSKLVLSDRLARWYLQFQQFEIVYIPQKAIKGQALVDFLADHPIPDDWELTHKLPYGDAMVIEV